MVEKFEFQYDDFYQICHVLFSITNLDVMLIDQEENILLQLNRLTIPASLQKTDIKYFRMIDTLQKNPPTSYYYHTNTYGLDYVTAGIWREGVYYGAIIVGPFLATVPDATFINTIISTNNLPVSEFKSLQEFYTSLSVISSSASSSIGAVLVNLCNHSYLQSQLIPSNALHPTRNKEKLKERIINSIDIIEFRYEKERALMEAISRGDQEGIQKARGSFADAYLENRIPESPIRSFKNLLIVLNTICRIAAKKGGVHPIFIHNLSEKYAILIERAPNLPQLNDLTNMMLTDYCELVKDYSTRPYSSLVKKAVDIITLHFERPLTLQGIAKSIHVNDSHLSRKFKEETGMSLIDYIHVKRIEAAKLYLESNKASITETALIVGFNDVNYFSRIFKKITNLTPSQYRRLHATGGKTE